MNYGTKKIDIALNARLKRVLCLDDLEREAQSHLPKCIFGYISGATETNTARERNRSSFARYDLIPNVLANVSDRTTETQIFDQTYDAPFGVAPMGSCALYAYRGDLALAEGTKQENVGMIMSGSSLIRLEEIIAQNERTWFQAYLPGEQNQIDLLINRVKQAGFKVLVITVDTCVGANRENNVRAGFSTPLKPTWRLFWDGITHPRWTSMTFLRTIVKHGMPHFENNFAHRGAPIFSRHVERDFSYRDHLSWEHIEKIRNNWPGKLVIKGVLSTDDARKAVSIGADGIIVSNHGGRQLDYAIAPFAALKDIVHACPTVPVMLDSGVRRGTDVIKALALGAKFVFIGRPFAYAASIGGVDGVRHTANLLKNEINRDLGLMGINRLSEISESKHLSVAR